MSPPRPQEDPRLSTGPSTARLGCVHDVDRRMIDVPGARLYAEAHGRAQAPAVVLMGSLASDTAGWSQQIPALVDAGLRVVAFDYRGHGRSSTSRPPFTLSLFQQDLRAVMRSYALSRPHLVGLSLGGMIALESKLIIRNPYITVAGQTAPGKGITLRDLRVNGMLFGQQVEDVRIENCVIGGSETTGVQFADSQAVLVGNVIHDNDHGVNVAGKSEVRLERNVITRSLFEAVVVTDKAKAVLVSNTLVKNGGGAAFLGSSQSDVSGNVVGFNKIGFLFAASGRATTSFNAFFKNSDGDYGQSYGGIAADLNLDGWPDIYVSNDYLSNDILYINNQDGTFSNRIAEFIGHQSQFSMGNDVADFNNDGYIDFYSPVSNSSSNML